MAKELPQKFHDASVVLLNWPWPFGVGIYLVCRSSFNVYLELSPVWTLVFFSFYRSVHVTCTVCNASGCRRVDGASRLEGPCYVASRWCTLHLALLPLFISDSKSSWSFSLRARSQANESTHVCSERPSRRRQRGRRHRERRDLARFRRPFRTWSVAPSPTPT